MTRINFQEISLRAEKSLKCAGGCGRRLKRQKKFYQTINPFNKLPNGGVKDSNDIYAELKASAMEWKNKPETCEQCLISEASRGAV